MLNSERIFSDSRTLNAIEDTFFRRAMAIYCENESKKVMSELEASDTEPKRSAAPVSRIFAKLRRQSGFSNAFRIAKKITDRVALFVLAVVIIFVGAVTASADVRSSLAEFTSRWGTFTNIAEEPVDLDGEDVKSFSVDYATGWNFDSEGTRNIANGEKIFGGEIIGAVDVNEKVIGMDIGDITKTGKTGVLVSDAKDAEKLLNELKPDCVIVTTMSLLSDLEDALLTCAKCGCNAFTTCEEAFYPENSNPTLTKKIDKLAKENNCTITGSGYQDAFWGNLITCIMGASHNVTKIKGSSSYNVEDYGIALAKAHGAGLTKEEFEKESASSDNISDEERNKIIESGNYAPSYMWNVNGWLCDKLGLTVTSQRQKCVPTFNSYDIESETLGITVKEGMATGMSAIVTTETKEGITLETECIGKVYNKDEFDKNEWTIYGDCDTTLVINKPNTVELTCASIVNRIPDVINAPAGFVPTSRMGELKYIKKES